MGRESRKKVNEREKRWVRKRSFLYHGRETPFATGPEDTPEQILARIGETPLVRV